MGKLVQYDGVELNSLNISDVSVNHGNQSQSDVGYSYISGRKQDGNASAAESMNSVQKIVASKRPTRFIDFEALQKNFESRSELTQALARKKQSIISVILALLIVVSCNIQKVRCNYESESDCLNEVILPNLFYWLVLIAFNGIAARFQLEFLLTKLITWQIGVASLAVTLYMFMFNDNEISTTYYMGIINLFNLASFFFFFIAFKIAKVATAYLEQAPLRCLVISILIVVLAFLFFEAEYMMKSCNYWEKSITFNSYSGSKSTFDNSQGNTSNTNEGEKIEMCEIETPDVCWDSIMHRWQDLTSILSQDSCDKQALPSSSPFLKQDSNARFAAFSTEKESSKKQDKVLSSIQHFDSLQQAYSNKNEIVLDESAMKYHIQVQRDLELVKNMNAINANAINNSLAKNILMITVPGFGRAAMHLKLSKTLAWFEKHSSTRKTSEFSRYHASKLTHLAGVSSSSSSSTSMEEILFKDLKAAGYITGASSDKCLDFTYADHFGVGFSCDPNFQDRFGQHSLSRGADALVKRCLYQSDISSYVFDYTSSFLNAYKHQKKAFEMRFHFNHDLTGEVINYLDAPLAEFLQSLMLAGNLEDTIVILHSQSGAHKRGILAGLSAETAAVENHLPALFVSLPWDITRIGSDGFLPNQQALVTPNNFYHFIKHVAEGDNYPNKHLSLLTSLVNTQKTCKDLDIPDSSCACL